MKEIIQHIGICKGFAAGRHYDDVRTEVVLVQAKEVPKMIRIQIKENSYLVRLVLIGSMYEGRSLFEQRGSKEGFSASGSESEGIMLC